MKRLTRAFFGAVLTAAVALAEVQLPALISDGMVLQRDAACRVWGKAGPREAVTVELRGQKVRPPDPGEIRMTRV